MHITTPEAARRILRHGWDLSKANQTVRELLASGAWRRWGSPRTLQSELANNPPAIFFYRAQEPDAGKRHRLPGDVEGESAAIFVRLTPRNAWRVPGDSYEAKERLSAEAADWCGKRGAAGIGEMLKDQGVDLVEFDDELMVLDPDIVQIDRRLTRLASKN